MYNITFLEWTTKATVVRKGHWYRERLRVEKFHDVHYKDVHINRISF